MLEEFAVEEVVVTDIEHKPFKRKEEARRIAQEWFAITELSPGFKGEKVPFAHIDYIPGTLQSLAEVIGVQKSTLYRWRHTDDSFQRAVSKLKKRRSSDDLLTYIGAIDDVLVQKAKKGDNQAMRLYYEQIEKREGWDSLKWEDLPDGVESIDSIIVMIKASASRIKEAMIDKNDITDVMTDAVMTNV